MKFNELRELVIEHRHTPAYMWRRVKAAHYRRTIRRRYK